MKTFRASRNVAFLRIRLLNPMVDSPFRYSRLATFAVVASAPSLALASGSPVTGEGLVLAVAWLATFAVQLIVTIAIAVGRGRARGWRSGLAYVAGSLMTMPVAVLLIRVLPGPDGP